MPNTKNEEIANITTIKQDLMSLSMSGKPKQAENTDQHEEF
jgi:hypothetical protein